MCVVCTKSPDENPHKKLDNGYKKRAFMMVQEVWLDHSCPCFPPKELRSYDSKPLKVIRSLPGGIVELYHLTKGLFNVDGQQVKDAKPVLNPG